MAQPAHKTIELPRMRRIASIVPTTLNAEARTVSVVWSTGARVRRYSYSIGPYWEELSLDPKAVLLGRLNNGAPLLNAHDGEDANATLGVVVAGTAAVDGKRGTADVRFARAEDDPVADQVFRKVKDGIIQNLSVGYDPLEMELIEEGVDQLPVYLVTLLEPYELSVVPMGADDGAGFRAESTARRPCTLIRQKDKTMADEDKPTPTPSGESPAVTATRAAAHARVENAKAIAAAQEEASQHAIATERTRSAAIRQLARQHGMGDTWAQNLVDAGTPVNEAREAILTDLAQRDATFQPSAAVRIGAGDDERDKFVRGASAWLWQRYGQTELIGRAKKARPVEFAGVELDPGEFRGMSPIELARFSLERQKINTRGMDVDAMVGRAFTQRGGSFQTSSDFALLLENAMGKVLLGGYATQDNTWSRICASKDVPDFRPSGQYRTGSMPSLQPIGEHGEYKTAAIPDGAKYTIQTARLGIKFSISRETIINDDMGVIAQESAGFGSASMRTIEENVYALLAANGGLGPTLADGRPFFDATRGNVNPVGSALSVAGIDADRVVLRAQKDPSGRDFLDLVPAVLLVPDSLYGQATVINESQYDTDRVANGRNQEPNRVRGLFRDLVGTPRTTATAPRRYIFAQTMDAIVVAFLQGRGRAPVIETANAWNIDGVEWKLTLYAKAQTGDPKSALTNAGA
jgi:phage head maturation protease